MKTYRLSFSHPVSGTIFLTDIKNKEKHVFNVSSNDDNVVEIPLKGIKKGLWHIMFEWEYDNREFIYSSDIRIN